MASDIILISVSHNTHALAKNASIPGACYPLVSSRTIVRDCRLAPRGRDILGRDLALDAAWSAWMLAGIRSRWSPVERESSVAGQAGRSSLARWQLRGRAACSFAATGAGGTQPWQSRWPVIACWLAAQGMPLSARRPSCDRACSPLAARGHGCMLPIRPCLLAAWQLRGAGSVLLCSHRGRRYAAPAEPIAGMPLISIIRLI